MLILFGTHGSPGVTTSAFLIASFWSELPGVEECTLIECDPTGGVLTGMIGLDLQGGATPLVLAGGSTKVSEHSQTFSGDPNAKLKILNMPTAIRSSYDVASAFARDSHRYLNEFGRKRPVVIDAGRMFHNSPCLEMLGEGTNCLLVVGEGDIPSLAATSYFKEITDRMGCNAGLLSIGQPLWAEEEYRDVLGLNLVGWIAEHPDGYVDLYSIAHPPNIKKVKAFSAGARASANQLYEFAYPSAGVFFQDSAEEAQPATETQE